MVGDTRASIEDTSVNVYRHARDQDRTCPPRGGPPPMGPVGLADQVGHTNATLAATACRRDGTLPPRATKVCKKVEFARNNTGEDVLRLGS